MTWPYLKGLNLSAVNMNQSHIIDFMKRHSASLKHLRLSSIFLDKEGSWEATFRAFKQTLFLYSARFDGVFGVEGSTKVDNDGELEFDSEYHLAIRHVLGYHRLICGLQEKDYLGKILENYF